jgi:hypothetical protein
MSQDYFKDQKSLLSLFFYREISVKVIFEILLNLGNFYKIAPEIFFGISLNHRKYSQKYLFNLEHMEIYSAVHFPRK